MTISIGRLVDLPNPSDLEVRRGAVSLGGYVTGASVAEGLAYRDEFAYLAETDAPIPVVYSSDSSIDGFYRVMASQSNLHMQTPTTALVYWSVDLIRVGERFQSKLTQLTRANDLGYTENDLAFVGLPVGAYGFVPGTTTARTRTTAAGDTIVHQVAQYGGGSGAVAPSWGCAPADYLKGACKITTGGYVRVSRVSPNTPASFILENELVRVTEGTSGAIDVEHYDGTAWRSLTYTFSSGGVDVTAWDHLTILRNDFERCQIRLVAERTTNKGRLQLDLGLRRASRNLDIVFTSEHNAAALKIRNGVTGTPTGAPSGALIAAATSNGNRYLLGSELSTSQDTANGGISKTASRLPAVASLIVNYAAPAGGDAGADLWGAYMEHITEKVREVRP